MISKALQSLTIFWALVYRVNKEACRGGATRPIPLYPQAHQWNVIYHPMINLDCKQIIFILDFSNTVYLLTRPLTFSFGIPLWFVLVIVFSFILQLLIQILKTTLIYSNVNLFNNIIHFFENHFRHKINRHLQSNLSLYSDQT